jgi:arsenate reductase
MGLHIGFHINRSASAALPSDMLSLYKPKRFLVYDQTLSWRLDFAAEFTLHLGFNCKNAIYSLGHLFVKKSVKKSKPAVCTFYHNPRCSKSRAALALLQSRGIDPTVIEYLKTPPTASELKALLQKLKLRPSELLRTSEDVYKSKVANKDLSDAQLIALMADNPVLIERPIVVLGERAAVGRPPENVLQLLK